jgi:hypothetical protein
MLRDLPVLAVAVLNGVAGVSPKGFMGGSSEGLGAIVGAGPGGLGEALGLGVAIGGLDTILLGGGLGSAALGVWAD